VKRDFVVLVWMHLHQKLQPSPEKVTLSRMSYYHVTLASQSKERVSNSEENPYVERRLSDEREQ